MTAPTMRCLLLRALLSACVLASLGFASPSAMAQDLPDARTSSCNFDDNSQMAIQYQPITVNPKKRILGNEIPYNKVWTPGGKAMTLFTNVPLKFGSTPLAVGAYTLFVIPGEKNWTMIVSKATDVAAAYDVQKDIARAKMETGELGSPESQFSVYLAHEAPTECMARLDLGKTRAWVAFEKQ